MEPKQGTCFLGWECIKGNLASPNSPGQSALYHVLWVNYLFCKLGQSVLLHLTVKAFLKPLKPYYSNYQQERLINELWGQVSLSLNRPHSIIYPWVWGYSSESCAYYTSTWALRPGDQLIVLAGGFCRMHFKGMTHIFQSEISMVWGQQVFKVYPQKSTSILAM